MQKYVPILIRMNQQDWVNAHFITSPKLCSPRQIYLDLSYICNFITLFLSSQIYLDDVTQFVVFVQPL